MNRTWIHIGTKWINLEHVAEFTDGMNTNMDALYVEGAMNEHDQWTPGYWPMQPCLTITMMTHYIDGKSGYPIEHEFFGAERDNLLEFINGNVLRAIDLTVPTEPHDEAEAEAYTDYDIYLENPRDMPSNRKYDRD